MGRFKRDGAGDSRPLLISGSRADEVSLLTIPEVARQLRVSPGRAYHLARSRLIPTVRLGRQVRVDPEQLAAWIASGGDSATTIAGRAAPRNTSRHSAT